MHWQSQSVKTLGHVGIQNINGRLIPTAEVTSWPLNQRRPTNPAWTHTQQTSHVCCVSVQAGLVGRRWLSGQLVTSAVGITLPLIFCIWDNLLIQVYKWSGTTHWFVAVELQILLYSCRDTLFKTESDEIDTPFKTKHPENHTLSSPLRSHKVT